MANPTPRAQCHPLLSLLQLAALAALAPAVDGVVVSTGYKVVPSNNYTVMQVEVPPGFTMLSYISLENRAPMGWRGCASREVRFFTSVSGITQTYGGSAMLGFGNATARYYIGSNATGDAVQLFLTAMECDVDVSVSLDFYSFVPAPQKQVKSELFSVMSDQTSFYIPLEDGSYITKAYLTMTEPCPTAGGGYDDNYVYLQVFGEVPIVGTANLTGAGDELVVVVEQQHRGADAAGLAGFAAANRTASCYPTVYVTLDVVRVVIPKTEAPTQVPETRAPHTHTPHHHDTLTPVTPNPDDGDDHSNGNDAMIPLYIVVVLLVFIIIGLAVHLVRERRRPKDYTKVGPMN